MHSVPVTFISETIPLSSTTNDNSRNATPKPNYTSKYESNALMKLTTLYIVSFVYHYV